VGIKETEDPIPLCYYFDFDRKAVWNDIHYKGATDIPKVITARVKAGECRCKVTNPSDTCCLGNVYRAVKQTQAMRRTWLFAEIEYYCCLTAERYKGIDHCMTEV
jgi:hypothetical protein